MVVLGFTLQQNEQQSLLGLIANDPDEFGTKRFVTIVERI